MDGTITEAWRDISPKSDVDASGQHQKQLQTPERRSEEGETECRGGARPSGTPEVEASVPSMDDVATWRGRVFAEELPGGGLHREVRLPLRSVKGTGASVHAQTQ